MLWRNPRGEAPDRSEERMARTLDNVENSEEKLFEHGHVPNAVVLVNVNV